MTQWNDGRKKAGLEIIEKLGWGQNEAVRELDEDLWRIISEANFGTIWARPGMSLRDRELVCMAILIAIGAPGVAIHFQHAHRLGFTDDDLRKVEFIMNEASTTNPTAGTSTRAKAAR